MRIPPFTAAATAATARPPFTRPATHVGGGVLVDEQGVDLVGGAGGLGDGPEDAGVKMGGEEDDAEQPEDLAAAGEGASGKVGNRARVRGCSRSGQGSLQGGAMAGRWLGLQLSRCACRRFSTPSLRSLPVTVGSGSLELLPFLFP